MLKRLIFSVVLSAALAAPGVATAKTGSNAPPGNSGIDQYLEQVPDSSGNKPAVSTKKKTKAPVSKRTAKKLSSSKEGQKLLEVAATSAPASTGTGASSAGGSSSSTGGGSSSSSGSDGSDDGSAAAAAGGSGGSGSGGSGSGGSGSSGSGSGASGSGDTSRAQALNAADTAKPKSATASIVSALTGSDDGGMGVALPILMILALGLVGAVVFGRRRHGAAPEEPSDR